MSKSKNVIHLRYHEGLWDVLAADYELAVYKKSLRDGEIAQDTRTRLGQGITDLCKLSAKAMKFLGVVDGQYPEVGEIPKPVLERFEKLMAITRDHCNSRLRS